MRYRTLSTLFFLPLVIYVIYRGGILFDLTIFGCTLIAYYEYFRAFNIKNKSLFIVSFVYISVIFYMAYFANFDYFFIANIILIISMMSIYLSAYPSIELSKIGYISFSYFYILFLMISLRLVKNHVFYGDYMIWLVFVIAFISDSSAMIIGNKFGTKKLVPQISPAKTVEGAIGALISTGFFSVVFGIILHVAGFKSFTFMEMLVIFVIGVIGSVISQFGDLIGSAIKRQAGIKDFGNIIPGHGGLLDRLDSILLTAGYLFIIQTIFGRIV